MNCNILNLAIILRRHSTESEKLLWRHLRKKQMEGYKFRRQQPIENYIVDFVCFENKLIIEIDGGQHAAKKSEEEKRDEWLRSRGYEILRFWNNEITSNLEGVLEAIRQSCISPSPQSPPVKGGEVARKKSSFPIRSKGR